MNEPHELFQWRSPFDEAKSTEGAIPVHEFLLAIRFGGVV